MAGNSGTVYLVGAGPGDPGLITVKGLECLKRAEVVVCDYLVNRSLLKCVSPDAEIVELGHHDAALSQDEINARMIAAARAGKTVVRLKGGDPHVFGRVAEETAALLAAGVRYEVVPGVTAAVAAAACAGIPLTHASRASAVALVTGHQRRDKSPPLDYGLLAEFPGTLVFYMGVTSAAEWSGALLARGKPPATPVAIVRRCSWPDQSVVRCTLGTVAAVLDQSGLRPPGVIVVGEVVADMPSESWFAARPLFGRRILVTRPEGQADALVERLRDLGAEVFEQPAIEIGPPDDWRPVDAAIARLDEFDWIVFSSVNGVTFFLDRLWRLGGDWRQLGSAKLAAIGPGTARELQRQRLRPDLVPARYRAESLAAELTAALGNRAPTSRVLLVRASRGREVLADELRAAGAAVEQVVAYASRDVECADPAVAEALRSGRIDWVTVTSSAIARSLAGLFGDDLGRARLASISPITSGVLRELGFSPAVEAEQYTIDGLIEALLKA